jgi:hypothetical protein
MSIYTFNKSARPDLTALTEAIAASSMADKNLGFLRWDEEKESLEVHMQNSLVPDDETILSGLVADS